MIKELTHDLNLDRSSRAVSPGRCVPRTCMSPDRSFLSTFSMISVPLGKTFCFLLIGRTLVSRSHTMLSIGYPATGAGHAKSFTSDDGLFVHVSDERQTVDVQAGRVFSGSKPVITKSLPDRYMPPLCSVVPLEKENKERHKRTPRSSPWTRRCICRVLRRWCECWRCLR